MNVIALFKLVNVEGKLDDGRIFHTTKGKQPFKFVLGRYSVISGIEQIVKDMNKGEVSDFIFSADYGYGKNGDKEKNIPENATLHYNIELVDFYERGNETHGMEPIDRYKLAVKHKESGVSNFKIKKYNDAIIKFEDAFKITEHLYIDKEKVPEKDILSVRIYSLMNIANCYNQLRDYKKAIKWINKAFEQATHPKMYYYRGISYMNTAEFDLAEKDFLELKKQMIGDPTADDLLEQLKKKKIEIQGEEKKVFKSFLRKNIYEEAQKIEINNEIGEFPNFPLPSNPKVFFDIRLQGEVRRVEFELFAHKVPKTAENFRIFCTGNMGGKMSYKNTIFHRVVFGFGAQGGDFENHDGTGGCSIYGKRFEDENFSFHHSKEGLLSMANSGPNTNGSQFFVTFQETPWLNGKHVVFGRVIKGMDVFKDMELVDVEKETEKPLEEITIINSGQV